MTLFPNATVMSKRGKIRLGHIQVGNVQKCLPSPIKRGPQNEHTIALESNNREHFKTLGFFIVFLVMFSVLRERVVTREK